MEMTKIFAVAIICIILSAGMIGFVYTMKRLKAKKIATTPVCTNCEFYTPYQMLNNRDQHVNVHHCSILSARIKSIHADYIIDMAVSVNDPENFSCNKHKFLPQKPGS